MIQYNQWERQGWAPKGSELRKKGFLVEPPAMDNPEKDSVVLLGGEPQAWRIAFMDPRAAYFSLGANLDGFAPKPPLIETLMAQRASERGGAIYVMFPAAQGSQDCRCNRAWLLRDPGPFPIDPNPALIENASAILKFHGWRMVEGSCSVHSSWIGPANHP